MTQPALSQQIQKLEEELGVRIFDRSRQPVVPTEPGERVLAQARVILREAERMADVVAGISGEVAPGAYSFRHHPDDRADPLPRFLPGFIRRHARVELVVEELQTAVMVARLADDTLDGGLAATPLHASGIHERPSTASPSTSTWPRDTASRAPGPSRNRSSLSESVWIMAEGHCFREQVLQLCGSGRTVAGKGTGSVRFESGNFDTLVRLVDADFGVTILPELVIDGMPPARRKARVRPFAPPVPTREVSFVHSRDHLRRAIADALVEEVRRSLPPELVAAARGDQRLLSPLPVADAMIPEPTEKGRGRDRRPPAR